MVKVTLRSPPPGLGPAAAVSGLPHPGISVPPRRAASARMSEPQAHLAATGFVIRDVDVLGAAGIGRITALPVLELRIDAVVGPSHVDRLALCVQRHAPRTGDTRVTDAGDRMGSGTRRLDRSQLRRQRCDESRCVRRGPRFNNRWRLERACRRRHRARDRCLWRCDSIARHGDVAFGSDCGCTQTLTRVSDRWQRDKRHHYAEGSNQFF